MYTINSTFYSLQKQADYSYLVYTDGTNYYMQNGKNSQIDYQSANATKVLSNTFGNASLVQGSVHIKPGTYLINQTFIGSNTKVYGEPGTIIKLAPGQAGGAEKVLQVADAENVTISDLTIDGNLPAYLALEDGIAIGIVNSRHVTIQDCCIQNSRIYGVLVFSAGSDVYDINILHNRIYYVGYNGITYATYGAGSYLHDCLVDGNYVEGAGDIGLNTQLQAGADAPYRIHFVNNNVNGTIPTAYRGYGSSGTDSTAYGLRLENGIDCLVDNNQFHGCDIGAGDDAHGYGNIFSSNQVTNDGIEPYAGIQVYAANATVEFNKIYTGFAEWNIGVDVIGDNSTIRGNTIVNQGGSANVAGIGSDTSPNSEIVLDNVIIGCEYSWNIHNGNFSIAKNNIGYNPVGIISTPVYGSYLVDNIQGTGAIVNNTLYTCWQSPKDIYISGGTVSSVQVEGTTVFTATDCMVHVEPDDTFKIVWSSVPIIVVIGE
jgi:hypothetical protein